MYQILGIGLICIWLGLMASLYFLLLKAPLVILFSDNPFYGCLGVLVGVAVLLFAALVCTVIIMACLGRGYTMFGLLPWL